MQKIESYFLPTDHQRKFLMHNFYASSTPKELMQLGGIKVSGGKVESGAYCLYWGQVGHCITNSPLAQTGEFTSNCGGTGEHSLLSPLPVTYLPRAWLSLLICPQYLLNIITLDTSPTLACTTSHILKGSQCRPTFVSHCQQARPHLWGRKKIHCTLYFQREPLQGATKFTWLNLRNAHHLVCNREGDKWRTNF